LYIKITQIIFSEVAKIFHELQDILAKTNYTGSGIKPHMEGFMALRKVLRSIRTAIGYTQQELGMLLGFTSNQVCLIERGYKAIDLDTIRLLFYVLVPMLSKELQDMLLDSIDEYLLEVGA
jgi:DNA-binding XRE family transcriptional regulator